MIDTMLSLFQAAPYAQIALKVPPSWLPAPGWFVAASGLLGLGVVLAILLLKDIRLAVELGIGAVVAGFIATVGFGWQEQEANKWIPKLNAANAVIASDNARAESYRADIDTLRKRLATESKAKRAALAAAAAKTEEAINAQPIAVRTIVVPAAVGIVLNDAISAANVNTDAGAGVGSADLAATHVPGDTDLEATERWAAQVVKQYGDLAEYAGTLRAYARGQVAAEASADAAHPPPGQAP